MIGQESSYTGYIEQTVTNGSFLCTIPIQMAKEDFRSSIYSAAPQETGVNIDMVISENGVGHDSWGILTSWVCWANKIFVLHCIEPSMQLGIDVCLWKGTWTRQQAVL